ncbi:hypothetical protein [Proteiniphilum sp. X52]|uniref:hypothetical protein n=1 Tax=Proteiniphilum sp. X52 TaxID=2382159 RepID=UPI0016265F62|nr:hypothetical protein [Proteiniphilum sp. X52]
MTREILSTDIEKVYADGAYNSPVSQEYCQDNEISLQLTGRLPTSTTKPSVS